MNELSNQSPAPSQSAASDQEPKFDMHFCACGAEWQVKRKVIFGHPGRFMAECKDCISKRRQEAFGKTCPKLYQATDPTRLPKRELAEAMRWAYGSRGLILLGDTGLGKTRVAWSLIKRVLTEDAKEVTFRWFDCIGFGHDIAKHYRAEDAEVWLERMAKVDLLFLDDLGKLKLTERAEVELFGLIERRCAAELPIIVTTNDTGDSLAARMTDNRGPAMIRRLREFCDPIHFQPRPAADEGALI